MSMQDPLADMLTRIRNAQLAEHSTVSVPHSKLKQALAKVLKDEGYINNYRVEQNKSTTVHSNIVIELKYFNGEPVIEFIERLSRPGLRYYSDSKNIPKVNGGLGIAIVSTNKGVMTDKEARSKNLGGEVLCKVF